MPSAQYPIIFISYLRATGRADARAVFLQLLRSFDETEIYFDRDPSDIPIGARFPDSIKHALALRNCQDLWIGVSRDLLITS